MTQATPEMEEVVGRLEALADSIRDRDEGMFTIRSIRADQVMLDLRALISDHRKMVEALAKVERETDFAHSGLKNLDHDFAELESLWPASKRGSRAERAYRAIKERVEAIALCVRDARAALTGSREQ